MCTNACGRGQCRRIGKPKPGRPPKLDEPKPIAPYDSDPISAVSKVFDRITGKSVEPTQLKTYAEVLCQYHLSSENKFENGHFLDRGRTERRHIIATEFVLIGKEANMVGESGEADPIVAAVEEFKDLVTVYCRGWHSCRRKPLIDCEISKADWCGAQRDFRLVPIAAIIISV